MQESFFMGQGSYGCVYRKQLKCLNKKTKPSKEPRLSKIQRTQKTAEREIAISAKVRKIPNFQLYFSPVLNNCIADLAQLSQPDLDKCDFIKEQQQPQQQPQIIDKNVNNQQQPPQNKEREGSKGKSPMGSTVPLRGTNHRFPLTETKYVFGESLNKYIRIATTKVNNHQVCLAKKILFFNTLLIHSVKKLALHKLIHADLNDGNILIDITDRPIIIDFGLSIDLNTPLTKEIAKQAFFFYPFKPEGTLDSYEPWAVEIAINSFLLAKIGWDKIVTEPYLAEIKSVSDRYIDGLKFETTHKNTFSKQDIALYKTKKHRIIDNFLDKPVSKIITDLTNASYHFWDIYAIGIMTSKYMNFYCPAAITPEVADKLKQQILF
jgi:serine/threonine protein kinase